MSHFEFTTFGAAYSGEGENRVRNPIPSPGGVDLELLRRKLIATTLEVLGDKREAFMSEIEAMKKDQFPAHREGKDAYSTVNTVISLLRLRQVAMSIKEINK